MRPQRSSAYCQDTVDDQNKADIKGDYQRLSRVVVSLQASTCGPVTYPRLDHRGYLDQAAPAYNPAAEYGMKNLGTILEKSAK